MRRWNSQSNGSRSSGSHWRGDELRWSLCGISVSGDDRGQQGRGSPPALPRRWWAEKQPVGEAYLRASSCYRSSSWPDNRAECPLQLVGNGRKEVVPG